MTRIPPDVVSEEQLTALAEKAEKRCGHTVVDADGIQEPCDEPATGWRWYQNEGDHEDLLDVACWRHENEGGRRIHAAEAERDAARAELADARRALEEIRAYCESDGGGEHVSKYEQQVYAIAREAVTEQVLSLLAASRSSSLEKAEDSK